MSEENFRKSEQRLREKEDKITQNWHRLETLQSHQVDKIAQKRVYNATGDQPRNGDDCTPLSEDTFSEGIKGDIREMQIETSQVFTNSSC